MNNVMANTIPPEIGNCTRLEFLSLARNQVCPPFYCCDTHPRTHNLSLSLSLSLSRSLALSHSHTHPCCPPHPTCAPVLRALVCGHQLQGTVPDTIANLTNLKMLYLNQNLLTSPLPDALVNRTMLPALKTVYLHRNLWSLPAPRACAERYCAP